MFDQITTLGNSCIQHGHRNNRIYLMHLSDKNVPWIIEQLDAMAKSNSYSKIFVKIPKSYQELFSEQNYIAEGMVPKFFNHSEDCIFMSKFLDKKRNTPVNQKRNQQIIEIALSKKELASLDEAKLPAGYLLRKAIPSDAENMARLYSTVFESYPFPIFDPSYIKKTMNENIVYYGVWKEHSLIALSSCEMSMKDKNVEMTDFAILPNYRNQKLSHILLSHMEKEMAKRGIKTAYTIARSASAGMNCTFGKNAYHYGGTLIQNTQISGSLEDMNIWFKGL